MGKYSSYRELQENETEGRDYQVRYRHGKSGIGVIAPHGGGIEPGTTEIAEAIAVDEHSFYSFCGLKEKRNVDLHITSVHFDEPVILEMVKELDTILTIHGCKGEEEAVYIGGRNGSLREQFFTALSRSGFVARENPRFPGLRPENICNRSRFGKGVQLEISIGLRRRMFEDFFSNVGSRRTEVFTTLVSALRQVLSEPLEDKCAPAQPLPSEWPESGVLAGYVARRAR
jgi:phage replication-related protein YjqB (UPF0714/DUF867 family)